MPTNTGPETTKTCWDDLFSDLDLFNELDEEHVGLGPRLFDDEYYDEAIELDLAGGKDGKGKGRKQ